jgi:glutaredoxin
MTSLILGPHGRKTWPVTVVFVAMVGTGSWGCKRATPAAPAQEAPLGDLEILKDGRFLFTYVEPSGTFATTDKPEIIPEQSRKMVRVIDPAQTKIKNATTIYTANANDLLKSGKASARPLSREAFETSAIAQLPPGASSLRGAPPNAARRPAAAVGGPDAGVAATVSSPPGKPVVTIYGTSWCGACQAARSYFAERKIPFADKDIEQDPAAAAELGAKAAKMGIPTDRVPVLDVRGRLLLGFDRSRVEALLGDPT